MFEFLLIHIESIYLVFIIHTKIKDGKVLKIRHQADVLTKKIFHITLWLLFISMSLCSIVVRNKGNASLSMVDS